MERRAGGPPRARVEAQGRGPGDEADRVRDRADLEREKADRARTRLFDETTLTLQPGEETIIEPKEPRW